jgi:galactokinase
MPDAAHNADALSFPIARKLLDRARAELGDDFRGTRPIRLSRAPGRLDVMGGIADYTGSLVAEMPLDRSAAVALAERRDRLVQVFSFNLHDEHQPFTLRIPLDALASNDTYFLRREFDEPGRKFGGYLAGCLHILHKHGLIDLADPDVAGLNLAVLSDVPLGAGVSSSAAIEVATMVNLIDHFAARPRVGALEAATLCQRVENEVVGAPCGLMDQVASMLGEAGKLLLMTCQPHNLHDPLPLPPGIRVVGINSNVRHSIGGGQYGITRCAAFMAHAIILDRMRIMGTGVGRTLATDPTAGYLANLEPNDYKRIFREHLPEYMKGSEFLERYGKTIDTATRVEPGITYPVQHAGDHHVLEARRIRNFVDFIREASVVEGAERRFLLDKAGHLMYASNLSYRSDAMLGAPECDLLVSLVREREAHGLYGAKITGGGQGGTVAVLCNQSPQADAALADILAEYQRQTHKTPTLFAGTSPGAWHTPTTVIPPA